MYTNMKLRELQALAKEQKVKGYSRLRKAELIKLLDENESKQRRLAYSSVPNPPPRKQEKIIPHPEDMNIFEKQEMQKTRPQVKSKINEWYDWLVSHVPETIKRKTKDVFDSFKNKISELLYDNKVKDSLKDSIEKEARKEDEDLTPAKSEIEDLTPQLHEHAFNKAFQSFRIPGLEKTDVDVYMEKVRPYLKTLIEQELKELGSAKVQLHMWIKWIKQEKIAFHLDEEDMGELDIKNDQPLDSKLNSLPPRKQEKIIPHPEDMNIFEKEEMQKTRPQVKSKINEWYDWLVSHVPQKMKRKINDAFDAFKIKISGLYKVKDSLKDSIEDVRFNTIQK